MAFITQIYSCSIILNIVVLHAKSVNVRKVLWQFFRPISCLIFVSPAEQMRDLGVAISGNGGDGGGDGGSIGSAGGVNFPRLKF